MKAIVVVDCKWGIGKNNDLLFKLKEDMKFFRSVTLGKTVVMGANTFRSFPKGALPDRTNIVLDSSGTVYENVITAKSLEELDKILAGYEDGQTFVIGGASFYALMLSRCDTVYVTKVAADGRAELFFPNLDKMAEWACVSESEEVNDNGYDLTFNLYKRI